MHVYVDYPEEKSERDIMLLVRSEEQPGDTAKPAGYRRDRRSVSDGLSPKRCR